MKLVLIGIPGAGKSTQGNMLSRQLKIPYLSTGHIFREIAKQKTGQGRFVKETLNSGLLISDKKTIPIVEQYLSKKEYQNGYIIDGFPRTLHQAKNFKNNIDKCIYLEISEKEALWRLAYRKDNLRNDDTVAAVKKRIEIFNKVTLPVVNHYKNLGKFVVVDGTKKIKEVNSEILKSIGKQLVKKQIKEWQQKKKSIIAIVGLPGSGKSEAAAFFEKKGLTVVKFGAIVNDYVTKGNLNHSEEIHKKIREDFRSKYGMAAMAILNKQAIDNALNSSLIVVIDGMRSFEEYSYLKDKYKEVNVFIIALFANRDLRIKRIEKRGERSKLSGRERDINETLGLNMGSTIALSDFTILNNETIADLYHNLEKIYRTVYFS